MSLSQLFTLTVDGAAATWRVSGVTGRERIHAPYAFEVTCAAVDADGSRLDVILDNLVAQDAKLSWPLLAGGEREVHAVVDAAEAVHTGFRLRLVPKVALLDDAVDHQVFVDEDAVAIVKKVLGEHGLTSDVRVSRAIPKRAQCVQGFESDLAFVSRLLAEEGIAWYLSTTEKDTLVFTDQPGGFDDVQSLPVREAAGLDRAESVRTVRLREEAVSDKVTLRDYNFEKPLLDQTASADAGTSALERYEYPGWYPDPGLGKALAQLRLDQLRGRRTVLTGESTSRSLAPGYVLTLTDAEDDAVNGRWLLLEVTHDAADQGAQREERYTTTFIAVPADSGYRPEPPRAPRLGGIQTATVTGASGSEIHTEKHGRVKVLHRWDRRRPENDTSSTWIRVVQPATSGGFLLPRVGWEALVTFFERAADVPIVVGRLYNGRATPPLGLPGAKVVTSFGTQTTPGGGSKNGVSMDDTSGNEGMSFVASKDFNEKTENDKNTSITATDSWTIGANKTLIVGQVLNQTVGGAQSYTVGGSREVNVTSNKMVNAASESVMIGGLRLLNIGGDLVTNCSLLTRVVGAAKAELGIEHVNRAVKGASTTLVGGSWNSVAGASHVVNVLGASTELVAGAKSITASKYFLAVKGAYSETLASRTVSAGGERQEGFSAAASYTIGGSATIKGSDVTVSAKAKITIKAGGVTIDITPGSVKITGDFKGDVNCVDNGKVDYE